MKTISNKRCIEICTDWHGGQWSALYQFASCGLYVAKNHLRYLKELQECREPEFYLYPGTISKKSDNELNSAQRYFEKIGLQQDTPIKNSWITHRTYGYKIPISKDIRLTALNILV